MRVRLEAAGHLEGFAGQPPAQTPAFIDRPVMLVYSGSFESMDGTVNVSDGDIDELAKNHNALLARIGRMAVGQIPMKSYPPLQLDHSPSAAMTVGRLLGELTIGQTTVIIPGSGEHPESEIPAESRKALLGTVRVLGEENVKKVLDGRWTHVSIGMDLGAHTISELSITPFPAAAQASMLSNLSKIHSRGMIEGKPYQIETDDSQKSFDIFYKGKQVGGTYDSAAEALEGLRQWIEKQAEKSGKSGEDLSKGTKMSWKVKLSRALRLGADSEEDKKKADEKAEKMKKHLMDKEKMSAEDAEKKLAGMDEEQCSKLAAEADDEEKKKLAAEADEKAKDEEKKKDGEAKMAAAKTAFVTLAKGIKTKSTSVQLTARTSRIMARLSSYRSQAKVSPAEIKALDIAKLAASSDEVVEAALKTYEARQPVIDPTIYGTTKAVELSKIAEKYRSSKLELEMRLAMPSKRKGAEEQLKKLSAEEQEEITQLSSKLKEGEGESEVDAHSHYASKCKELEKMMDEGRDKEAMKAHMKRMLEDGKKLGGTGDSDEKRMSALDEEVKSMQTQIQELIQLASPVLGIEPKELD